MSYGTVCVHDDSYSTLNLNGMINYSIRKNRAAFNSSISLEAGDMGSV